MVFFFKGESLNIKQLSNPDLLSRLYERYYVRNISPDHCISSHWRKMNSEIDVRINESGEIATFKGYGFGDLQNTHFLNRIFNYFCNLSYFIRLPGKSDVLLLIKKATLNLKKINSYLSYDCFRQICSLCLIMRHFYADETEKFHILVIGDGYGFLSSLLKSIYKNAKITLVDIGKVLLFQAVNLQVIHPGRSHQSIAGYDNGLGDVDFLYVPAEEIGKIHGIKYRLIVNIASMGEMNYRTINGYFEFLRKNSMKDNLFYCCNRKSKILPHGESIDFLKYPWSNNDKHLVDEECGFYSYFLSLNFPFLHRFDGVFLHRLTKLSTGD